MKNKYFFILSVILVFVSYCYQQQAKSEIKSYDGYKVFRIHPFTISQQYRVEIILQNSTFDFWVKRSAPDEDWTVMVPPIALDDFHRYMRVHDIAYKEIIHNVEGYIMKNEVPDLEPGKITFNQYHDLETINNYLTYLIENNTNVAGIKLGETWGKNKILGLKISSGVEKNKPGILITSGLSGREWIGPAAALYIIENILKNSDMYQNIDWYFIPLLNPDGYEYTHKFDRMWQKNLNPQENCTGVDITKNFAYHWSESGSGTEDECVQDYIGPEPFSERESRALRKFMKEYGDNIKLYLSLRAFGPMILYPWTHTTKPANNSDELQLVGEEVKFSIYRQTGTNYRVDSYISAMYSSGGVDTDWMKGPKNVSLVYSIHIPAKGSNMFDPTENEIHGVVDEVYGGIQVFLKYVEGQWIGPSDDSLEL